MRRKMSDCPIRATSVLLTLLVTGCSDYGSMTNKEIEATLVKKLEAQGLELESVSLKESKPHEFVGKATKADGTVYSLIVTQEPKEMKFSYRVTDQGGEILKAGTFRKSGVLSEETTVDR